MRKIYSFFILMFFTSIITLAQDTLAGWTFPTGTAVDSIANISNAQNIADVIKTIGGTSAVDFSKNGFTTFAATVSGWDGGANTKYWQIEINTSGYNGIKINSLQSSGGNKPGPRDFIIQYKVGATGTWTDIPGSTIVTANDWTTAVINNLSVPSDCYNQPSVFLRWLMASDTSTATPPALVLSTGIDKIDELYITGTLATTIVSDDNSKPVIDIFPNPCTSELFVNAGSLENKISYEVMSAAGILIKKGRIENMDQQRIFVGDVNSGYYFIRISTDESTFLKKFIVL
jgi:hypothetical protein